MAATATKPTVGTIDGTPIVFFPVPTPWPLSAGCDQYIYRQLNAGTLLAWDPVYPQIFETAAQSCYPPQQSSWWSQDASADPSTALGPTFVCPESYSAVHSTVVESNSASQAQYTYCCPPNFGLNAILPPNQRSVIQCTSMADPGETLSLQSVTYLTTTVTVTGDNGSVTRTATNQQTHVATSTVVRSSAATVFAPPVNGYNIVQRQATSSTGTGATTSNTATASDTSSSQPSATSDAASTGSSGLAAGAIAGIVVGVVGVLALLALGVFFFLRRRRRYAAVAQPEVAAAAGGAYTAEGGAYTAGGSYTSGGAYTAGGAYPAGGAYAPGGEAAPKYYGSEVATYSAEMAAHPEAHEMHVGTPAQELGHGAYDAHELPAGPR